MSKRISRTALIPGLLAGGVVLFDLIVDHYFGGFGSPGWWHVILIASVLAISYIAVRRAMVTRERASAVLREAHEALERQVHERTAELELANQALRTSEETARALMDALNESAVLVDPQCKVLAANETSARRLGITPAQMIGASLFALFPPEVANRRSHHLEAILESHQPQHFVDERAGMTFENHIYPICDADGKLLRLAVFAQDITERLQAEQALRQVNERLVTTQDAAGVGSWDWDVRSGQIEWSAKMYALFGLDERRAHATLDGWRATLHPNDRDRVEHGVAAVLEGHADLHSEYRVILPDGRLRWITALGHGIYDDAGQPLRVSGICLDITERKGTEEALRASEKKYRLLFQNMVEGFALYELLYDEQGQAVDWRVLEVNDAYTRHTGVDRGSIVGRRISEIFPAALGEYLPRFAQVVETQTPTRWETYAASVNRYQCISTFPAGERRFANTIEDITDRKLAEEAQRTSEERFAAVFHFSPDGIAMFDTGGRVFLDVNEAFTRLTGYQRSEIVGRSWQELKLSAFAETGAEIRDLFRANRHLIDQEVQLTTRQGARFRVLVSLVPVTIGGAACILAIAHDVTQRRASEDALLRAQAELAQGIRERSALEERQRLARELHDSVSQTLYGISLGVNTALALFDTDRARVLEALTYALSLAHAGLAEMRALIFELRPESLKTEGLVVALGKRIAAVHAHYGFEVDLSLCEEPDVSLDVKETLYRIAQEALHNAVKHAQPDRLDVRLICAPDDIRLEVCDNGVGFDPCAEYPGHLGLHSMRERALSVGGDLEIVSAPGRGTQIRARIPIAAPAEDAGTDT
jgi:PAS domain S-box-containing protein